MLSNCTNNLLNLKWVKIKKFKHDEFKGNTNAGKYQCILVDVEKKMVIDILPDRTRSHLISYFTKYTRQERKNVKFFVCDM